MAMSQEHGSTLQEVQQLMKKNQVQIRACLLFNLFLLACVNAFTSAPLFIVLLPGCHCSALTQMQNLKLAFLLSIFLDASEGVTGPQRQD